VFDGSFEGSFEGAGDLVDLDDFVEFSETSSRMCSNRVSLWSAPGIRIEVISRRWFGFFVRKT